MNVVLNPSSPGELRSVNAFREKVSSGDGGTWRRAPSFGGCSCGIEKVVVQSVASVRSLLICKVITYIPAHGDMDFTVPLFDALMRRAVPMEKD
jgi:hypothetical protein